MMSPIYLVCEIRPQVSRVPAQTISCLSCKGRGSVFDRLISHRMNDEKHNACKFYYQRFSGSQCYFIGKKKWYQISTILWHWKHTHTHKHTNSHIHIYIYTHTRAHANAHTQRDFDRWGLFEAGTFGALSGKRFKAFVYKTGLITEGQKILF